MRFYKTNNKSGKIHSGHMKRSHVLTTDCGRKMFSWDVTDLGAWITDEQHETGFCARCKRTFQ